MLATSLVHSVDDLEDIEASGEGSRQHEIGRDHCSACTAQDSQGADDGVTWWRAGGVYRFLCGW
jgi:hypothetical protein